MHSDNTIKRIADGICAELKRQLDFFDYFDTGSDGWVVDGYVESADLAQAALAAARPRWVRLPDTRPTEWPWEGMMPENWVAAFEGSEVIKVRLGSCWWEGGRWRHSYATHVCPWSDIAALLPGENDA